MLSYESMEINFLFQLAILILSIVIHELSHGYTAYFLGDPTAKYAGRLTLNPIKHMELFGSFIVPIITSLLPGGIVFGWAKPVPFNPYNLRSEKWGEAMVAIAGPLSNIFIALVFGSIIRFFGDSLSSSMFTILALITLVNITLAIFNLMPIPPLDGSHILYSLLSYKYSYIKENIQRNALIYILIFIFVLWRFFEPLIPWLFKIITGVSLF